MAAVKEAEGAVASYEVNLKAIPNMPNCLEEGGGVLEGIWKSIGLKFWSFFVCLFEKWRSNFSLHGPEWLSEEAQIAQEILFGLRKGWESPA